MELLSPPYTHTPREGEVGGQLLMDAKRFRGTTKCQKNFVSEINLFRLHKIAWCPWQPIGHCSWVRSMSPSFASRPTQDRHLCAVDSFVDFSLLPLIQEKQIASYWRKKIFAK